MTAASVTVTDPRKVALVATMVELLESTDHKEIYFRLKTAPKAPPLVEGKKSSHRPDIFCRKKRQVLVESVTQADMKDLDKLKDRLYLFYTASEMNNWDFHLACYKILAPHLKNFCSKNAIRYSKMWDI